jgi:hypothetical protein
MKKLVLLVALLLVAFSVFAVDVSVEGALNLPTVFQHVYSDDPLDMQSKTVMQATAAGSALVFDFTSVFGLGIWADLFQSQVVFADDVGYPVTGPAGQGDYHSLTGANMLIGPVFYVYRQGGLRIPVSFGFHMFMGATDFFNTSIAYTKGLTSWFQLGLGLNAALQYRFDNRTYIFSRLQLSWDFWGASDTRTGGTVTKHSAVLLNTFSIDPSFGVGITFGRRPPAPAPEAPAEGTATGA